MRPGLYNDPMRIIIDGYNLIRRVPELKEADRTDLNAGRDMLIGELASYRTVKGHRITVVFDGSEALHLGGGVEKVRGITVRFSPRGSDADRVILEALGNSEADVLVSADRELVDAAMRTGVTAVPPMFFWDKVQEEMYRQVKGEELEDSGHGARGAGGRKLSRAQRRDRGRIERL
jgi:predicted RNA-binding protein with PIN domain